jgi:coenzyme F420-reducing hydrogenase delta subunit
MKLYKGCLNMSEHEPKIMAFLCTWCSYAAADLAGVSRMEYPPNIRVIRIPCTGRMSPNFILAGLQQGADAVWVSGCHPGECHYLEGNYYARRKFALMKNFLEHTGIEPGRLLFSWISSAESTKFVDVAKTITQHVKALDAHKKYVKVHRKIDET